MKYKLTFISLLFLFCLSSCQKNTSRQEEAQKIVQEWMGRTIEFPEYMDATSIAKDTVGDISADTPYKILLYTDSTGCTSCKLRLIEWNSLIKQADTLLNKQVSSLFYFHPKDKKELSFLFRRDRFEYPVFIDEENDINRLNQFPSQMEYQCFLLDRNNKVVSIGNPTLNPRVWELYQKIIRGEVDIKYKAQNEGYIYK